MPAPVERGGSFGCGSVVALSRAEAHGAAPGTEFRFPPAAESSPLGSRCARPAPRRRNVALTLAACAFAIAAWHGGGALYLYAKAELGQFLLHRAWNDARANGSSVKPWPWADTHPVARLTVPGRDVDLLVLSGANGRTLAWGPGHAERSSVPGGPGHAVVTAHRDTHFAFLRDLRPGETIVVERAGGNMRAYRVEHAIVADHRELALPHDDSGATLSLVTCYPFDGVNPRTPLRYAVVARAER